MINYRTIKRLLGETSLERKCRFLFGGGLLLLIASSFYAYARMTGNLVDDRMVQTARKLVRPVIWDEHRKYLMKRAVDIGGLDEEQQTELSRVVENLRSAVLEYRSADLEYSDEGYEWSLVGLDKEPPPDADAQFALREILDGDSDGDEFWRKVRGEHRSDDRLVYYSAIRVTKDACAECHTARSENRPYGLVTVELPLTKTEQALNWNNAILLSMAILTAFVAMLAAYAIVRYVIVKPVLHLKDVSDEIARGNLELRADINTGDEFEELSHAFNRMLRHMMTTQDELRELNTSLDRKVDELAQVNLRLYETNKLKDEFLATMTHELRTPLNSILGFSDVLGSGEGLNERQQRYVRNILTSGRGLMVLINDLLDLAKIESGKMELQVVECSVEELIERQTTAMLPMAAKKHIDLKCRINNDIPLLLQDSGKVQQILNNLLSNAVKFTPEGGRVLAVARMFDDETLEIVVEDTGIGIPLQEQSTVFEKFRQGTTVPGDRDAMARQYEGTGLGLSIVRELARLLGGDVLLESEFGKGSSFAVRIPIRVPVRRQQQNLQSVESTGTDAVEVNRLNQDDSPADSSEPADWDSEARDGAETSDGTAA